MNDTKSAAPEELSGFEQLLNEIKKITEKKIQPRNPLPRPFSQPATPPAPKSKKSSVWDDIP